MSASCPAAECDFSGPVEAVCGHLGGASDPLHEGLGGSDLPSEGASKGASVPFWAVVAGAVLIGGYLLLEGVEVSESGSGETAPSDGEQETTGDSPSEGASEGASEGGQEVPLVE